MGYVCQIFSDTSIKRELIFLNDNGKQSPKSWMTLVDMTEMILKTKTTEETGMRNYIYYTEKG